MSYAITDAKAYANAGQFNEAQTCALIAIAEQLQLANLISVATERDDAESDPFSIYNLGLIFENPGVYKPRLKASIAHKLGIEVPS